MPTFGSYERDPRLWQSCLDTVKRDMLAAGWNKHARKFWEVQHRKAVKLYSTGCAK